MKTHAIKRVISTLLLAPLAVMTAGQLKALELKPLGTNGPPLEFHGFRQPGIPVFEAITNIWATARVARSSSPRRV